MKGTLIILFILVVGGIWWAVENNKKDDAMMDDAMSTSSAMMDAPEGAVVIALEGKNFEFNQKKITVKEGDTVVINFTSAGGFHDWVNDEFNAKTARMNTGEKSSVTFVADKKGTYKYYCSVGNHRAQGMVGTLIVE